MAVQFGRNIHSLFRVKKKGKSCIIFATKMIYEKKKFAVLFVSLESFIAHKKEPL